MKLAKTTGGCLFSLGMLLFGGALLMLNGGIVATLYFGFLAGGPSWMRNSHLIQFCMFLGPVILLIVEWTVFDWVSGYRYAESRRWYRWVQRSSRKKQI